MSAPGAAELARREVVALHEFFVGWFTGALPASDFALCEAVFGPDFAMINPDGTRHDLAELLPRLRSAHGALPASFAIDVLDPRAVWVEGEAVLLEYVEQQFRDGRTTRRRSTALFTRAVDAPRGVLWRHLQETWIEAAP